MENEHQAENTPELTNAGAKQEHKCSCSSAGCKKMDVNDWLNDMPESQSDFDLEFVEVKFKNSRKDFFVNENKIKLEQGDIVVVEVVSGYDLGVVSLSGELVRRQMKRKGSAINTDNKKKIYRIAKPTDIEKWDKALSLEEKTKYRARELAKKFKLDMKISDVEFQGDKTKAIFYYIAEGRVDFRELIKSYAEEFKIRVEMKQIGARQEAGLLGALGPCGRELCCCSWYNELSSVNTSAARHQQLALNPMKLAGQCGKLKCCLNYELKGYQDAVKGFPDTNIALRSKNGKAHHQKTDVYKRLMWYTHEDNPSEFIEIPVDRVIEIIEQNKNGQLPEFLVEEKIVSLVDKLPDFENVVGQDSLTRFDKQNSNNNNNKKRKKKKKKPNSNPDSPIVVIKNI